MRLTCSIATDGLVRVFPTTSAPDLSMATHVFPDVERITHQGSVSSFPLALRFSSDYERHIEVLEVSWLDLIYGFVRFAHGAVHALSGRLVLDAALLAHTDGGILVVGNGKSRWAAEWATSGRTVIADDTVIVELGAGGVPLGMGNPSPIAQSRVGVSAPLDSIGLSVLPVTRLLLVDGTYGQPALLPKPDPVHAWSSILKASLGRCLNTRAFPATFSSFYPGDREAAMIAAQSARGLLGLPCSHALGQISVQQLATFLDER